MVQSNDEKIAHLTQLLGQLITNQEWKKAFAIGEYLTTLDPEYYLAYRGMGYASFMLDDYEAAMEYTQKALHYGDKDIETLFLMSRIHAHRGDLNNEILWLNKALEQDLDYSKAAYYLAIARLSLGDREKGEKILQGIVKAHPENMPSRRSLADLYLASQELDKAEEQLLKAAEYDNRNSRVFRDLGSIEERRGNFKEALNQFIHALDLNPDDPARYYDIGNICIALNDPRQALMFLRKAHDIDPDNALFSYSLGRVYFDLHRFAECEAASKAALRHDPEMQYAGTNLGLNATINLGLAYLNRGKLQEAEQCFRKNLQLIASSYFNLGFSLHWQGRYHEALTHFLHAVELVPDDAGYWDMVGNAWMELDDNENARIAFEKAIAIDPTFPPAQYDLGVIFSRVKGKEKEAMKQFALAISLDEKYPLPYYAVACLSALEGNKKQALENLRKAVDYGFTNRGHADGDHDLDSLRDDPEFQEIMKKMGPETSRSDQPSLDAKTPQNSEESDKEPRRQQKKALGSGKAIESMNQEWMRYIW